MFGRFRRSEQGATAIEFAFVAGPFVFAMLATFEIAMYLWSSQVLETAISNVSRQIYTGQFQSSDANKNLTSEQIRANFKTKLCEQVTALINCTTDVSVDIRQADAFTTPTKPVKNGAYDASGYKYETVPPRKIGIVTASLEYKSIFPSLGGAGQLSNGNRLIMVTSVFRTEPYTN